MFLIGNKIFGNSIQKFIEKCMKDYSEISPSDSESPQ